MGGGLIFGAWVYYFDMPLPLFHSILSTLMASNALEMESELSAEAPLAGCLLGVLHRVLGVLRRVLGVLHRVVGVLHRVLGVLHRVVGVLHSIVTTVWLDC